MKIPYTLEYKVFGFLFQFDFCIWLGLIEMELFEKIFLNSQMKCAGWMNSIVISTVISRSYITANCHCQAIYYLPRQLNDPEIFQLLSFLFSKKALCVKGKTNSTLTWGNTPFTIALNSSIALKAIGKKK